MTQASRCQVGGKEAGGEGARVHACPSCHSAASLPLAPPRSEELLRTPPPAPTAGARSSLCMGVQPFGALSLRSPMVGWPGVSMHTSACAWLVTRDDPFGRAARQCVPLGHASPTGCYPAALLLRSALPALPFSPVRSPLASTPAPFSAFTSAPATPAPPPAAPPLRRPSWARWSCSSSPANRRATPSPPRSR